MNVFVIDTSGPSCGKPRTGDPICEQTSPPSNRDNTLPCRVPGSSSKRTEATASQKHAFFSGTGCHRGCGYCVSLPAVHSSAAELGCQEGAGGSTRTPEDQVSRLRLYLRSVQVNTNITCTDNRELTTNLG